MNLHEYQAKALLREYGAAIPDGVLAASSEEAADAARKLSGDSWVVKAQIHAGARAQAGGVRMVSSPDEAAAAARGLLGKRIVTAQTGPEGIAVKSVYVEKACDVDREIYAAILVHRAKASVVVLVGREGGTGVERTLARRETLYELPFGLDGADRTGIAGMAEFLSIQQDRAEKLASMLAQVRRAFMELDARLIEINPLAMTTDGDVVALDAKMIIDDNAMWRHPELEELRDEDEIHPQERAADRFEINYARMDGDIGILTMGAGLGLATMDMVIDGGGRPADFMDVRPMATREQVAEGVKLLLDDERVKVILVMAVGGGLLHCDTIAEGLSSVFRKTGAAKPVVYCAAGTGKEISEMTLKNQGVPVAITASMEEAVEEAVRIAGSRAA
ncbi:MAG: ADP-forming succinate--CoA ligase subunit beta [Alphaproteobacteria bacterium]|nr:ADP-forming succinate--CoA ligase subunit beta [Alphaproteobacteria bacterium]